MDFPSEFTLAEMVELESIYKDIGEASLDPEFCQRLATSFSFSVNRAGKPAITCEQVLSWFLEKQNPLQSKVTSPSVSSKLLVDLSDASFPDDSPQSSPKSKGSSAADLSELTFEAKSSKDNAWYDIASFHNYRVLCTGELEVRVRFAGYSNIHDEWVNLKRAVRERSIPLEPSECEIIQVGDLVLCFQERKEHAVYYDARILQIERQPHDASMCSCIFIVSYAHNIFEEKVELHRLCRRPTKKVSSITSSS
ncbi:hypothetical protein K2173_004272 [Erythroxylum novogranatense]|uniref:SAWADEE domain-containing protein n=1 Tax=Erythroxylum novogranatense TaxID=1862640 RepID=A0AAV8U2D8_9ROSI|nr:hypothetical protein K2173_004272 [Erythroxylum novogranatense]